MAGCGAFSRAVARVGSCSLTVVQAPVGEGHVHAEAGADLDQQRHEDGQRRLHRLDFEAGDLRQHARLRIGLGHRPCRPPSWRAWSRSRHMRDSSFSDCCAEASSALSLWNCWQKSRAALARDHGAFLGHDPVALGLEHVDLGGNGFRRPMCRDPGELLLGALGVGAQVLVGGGLAGALTRRVEPVERGVAQRRGHRVGDDHGPNQGRSDGLRPHPVAQRGKEERTGSAP